MKAARDARSAAVVINAGSRRGAAHELALDTMRKAGVPISSVHPVHSGADLAGTLDRVLADGHDLVVVGGGEGTMSHAFGRGDCHTTSITPHSKGSAYNPVTALHR